MASENILSRLSARLSGATEDRENPDLGTRNIGGSKRDNSPFIGGYFHIMFELPDPLFTGSKADAAKWLTATAESFTPHSETINSVEVPAFGGIKSNHYSGRMVTNEFTCAFREYQNMPVLNTLNIWTSAFDPFAGVSSLKGNAFKPSAYKGTAYVMLTKPVGAFVPGTSFSVEDIEEAWIYDGVFPISVPTDALSSDIQSNESIQYSVQFKFDGHPFSSSEGAIEQCLAQFEALGHSTLMASQNNMEKALGLSGNSDF